MATLAIRGHATRGNEVIEILEMLGGKSYKGLAYVGEDQDRYYCINKDDNFIDALFIIKEEVQVFTLEEFLEKYPYKVGDKVIVRERGKVVTITDMSWRNGREIIYETLFNDDCYECFSSEELQPYKEQEPMSIPETMKQITNIAENFIKIDIPKGYEFFGVDDDNQQVVFEKIKPQYPKTYEECYRILFYTSKNASYTCVSGYMYDKVKVLSHLLLCRDAYWKLAGDWKPDWTDVEQDKYVIYTEGNLIYLNCLVLGHNILAFPTAEMRDAFYENFKDLIEQCKELL